MSTINSRKTRVGVVFSKGERVTYTTNSSDLKSIFNEIQYGALDGYTPVGDFISKIFICFRAD